MIKLHLIILECSFMLGRSHEAQKKEVTYRGLKSRLTPTLLLLAGLIMGLTACSTPQEVIQAKATATATPPIPPVIEVSPDPTPMMYNSGSLIELWSPRGTNAEVLTFPDNKTISVPSRICGPNGGCSVWSYDDTEIVIDPNAQGGVAYFDYLNDDPKNADDITGCFLKGVSLPQVTEDGIVTPQFFKVLAVKETAGTIIACDLVFNLWDLDQQMSPEDKDVLESFTDGLAALAVMEPKNPFGIQYKGDPEWDKIMENFAVEPNCVTPSVLNTVGYFCRQGVIRPPQPEAPLSCDYSAIPICP